MIKFYIKKSFFDGLDNVAKLVVLNVIFSMIPVGLGYTGFLLLNGNFALLIVAVLCIFGMESFFSFGANSYIYRWSCAKDANFKTFKESYHKKKSHILMHWFLMVSTLVAIPYSQFFYLKAQAAYGILVAILLVWVEFVFLLIVQFYYPVCFYFNDSAVGALKRSFSLAINNLGFSLFVFLKSLLDLLLTAFFGTIIPGLGGVCISRMDAVRMLCLKYSNTTKKNWDEILSEEKEILGTRTLKGTLFPWKEKP